MRTLPAALLACLALPAWLPAGAEAQADPRPNVVVFMTDDQTRASLRHMPSVRALIGARGTDFRRAFATFPLCCPSRTTFLSGQYSHNHGVIHNAGPFGGYKVFEHPNALPVWLQAAGYRTMHVGRYLNGYTELSGIPPGWSDWHAALDPSTFNYARWRMSENGRSVSYPTPDHPAEHQTDFYGRRARELVEGAAPSGQPFFLNVWFAAPHSGRPRDPDDPPGLATPSPAPRHRDAFAGVAMPRPPSFDEAGVRDKPQVVADLPRLSPQQVAGIEENWRQEQESLLAVDEAVSSVIAALERSGELSNTLLAFTSDNGFMHGEHRRAAEKVLPYEESIGVPLLLRGPGVPAARSDRRLVGNMDLPATILDAAQATPGREQDGRSLLELLADPEADPGRDLLIENGQGANGVPAYRAIRTYGYTYVEHATTGEYELYDLEADPYQLRNVEDHDRYSAIKGDLARRLRALRGCAGSSCRAGPRLRLEVRARTRVLDGRRCVSGGLRARVGGPDRARVVRADVLLGARRVARVSQPPFQRAVSQRRLRLPRPERLLRVQARLRDGSRLTLDRRLAVCR